MQSLLGQVITPLEYQRKPFLQISKPLDQKRLMVLGSTTGLVPSFLQRLGGNNASLTALKAAAIKTIRLEFVPSAE